MRKTSIEEMFSLFMHLPHVIKKSENEPFYIMSDFLRIPAICKNLNTRRTMVEIASCFFKYANYPKYERISVIIIMQNFID